MSRAGLLPSYCANVATSSQPVGYNSVEWSQSQNGDPLVCVTGGSQIKVLNVVTGALVTVRQVLPTKCSTNQTLDACGTWNGKQDGWLATRLHIELIVLRTLTTLPSHRKIRPYSHPVQLITASEYGVSIPHMRSNQQPPYALAKVIRTRYCPLSVKFHRLTSSI